MNTIKAAALLLLALFAWMGGGCTTVTRTVTQKVNVPVPVPCRVTLPDEPAAMPWGDDIVSKTKALLAELELRLGYEAELRAKIEGCQPVRTVTPGSN